MSDQENTRSVEKLFEALNAHDLIRNTEYRMGSGTHKGGLRTPTGAVIPPTGKHARVPGSTTYQFKNGKIVQSTTYWDMVTLLAQLGLMPGM